MRVSVELPDPKKNGLDAAIAKQFADIQRQLMTLMKAKDASTKATNVVMMKHLKEQQDALVKAMERLMTFVGTENGKSLPKRLVERFNALESAFMNGSRKSRNRTFGSNF